MLLKIDFLEVSRTCDVKYISKQLSVISRSLLEAFFRDSLHFLEVAVCLTAWRAVSLCGIEVLLAVKTTSA